MPKLKIIAGTEAPQTVEEQVRKNLRKTRIPSIPQCPTCSSRTYMEAKTDSLTQNICVHCLAKGRVVVME